MLDSLLQTFFFDLRLHRCFMAIEPLRHVALLKKTSLWDIYLSENFSNDRVYILGQNKDKKPNSS